MLNGVSEDLKNTIKEIMESPLLASFNLGGGTNLALKYNHRLSVDIDLFSAKIHSINELDEIANYFIDKYNLKETIDKYNFNKQDPYSEKAWIKIGIPALNTKIDIIQNLQLLKKPEIIDGIRLIHDDDIGALKLLAAANRGSQKDFYDLFLLTNKKPLEHYYELLMERQKKFANIKTIFDEPSNKPKINLEKDISSLCDFNNANDLSRQGNQIVLTTNSPIKENWFNIKQVWKKRVEILAENKNLILKETTNKTIKRGFKF